MAKSVADMEAALLALGTAHADYMEHFRALSREMHRPGVSAHTAVNEQFTLNEQIGSRGLASHVVLRLRGLGMQDVLDVARDHGYASETWAAEFIKRLERVKALED